MVAAIFLSNVIIGRVLLCMKYMGDKKQPHLKVRLENHKDMVLLDFV